MILRIAELSEEQSLQIGKALADALLDKGVVEYYDSFKFGDGLEVIRMNDIEAISFLADYLDSIGTSIDDWIEDNELELFQYAHCGYGIYSRDAINDIIEKDNDDFADYAENENIIARVELV
jgi:hypothetical protein